MEKCRTAQRCLANARKEFSSWFRSPVHSRWSCASAKVRRLMPSTFNTPIRARRERSPSIASFYFSSGLLREYCTHLDWFLCSGAHFFTFFLPIPRLFFFSLVQFDSLGVVCFFIRSGIYHRNEWKRCAFIWMYFPYSGFRIWFEQINRAMKRKTSKHSFVYFIFRMKSSHMRTTTISHRISGKMDGLGARVAWRWATRAKDIKALLINSLHYVMAVLTKVLRLPKIRHTLRRHSPRSVNHLPLPCPTVSPAIFRLHDEPVHLPVARRNYGGTRTKCNHVAHANTFSTYILFILFVPRRSILSVLPQLLWLYRIFCALADECVCFPRTPVCCRFRCCSVVRCVCVVVMVGFTFPSISFRLPCPAHIFFFLFSTVLFQVKCVVHMIPYRQS